MNAAMADRFLTIAPQGNLKLQGLSSTDIINVMSKYITGFNITGLYYRVYITGFPGGSVGKDSACNAGDLGLIPRLGRYPGEGKGYSLQYSGLENPMDCIVHGITKNQT